MSSAIIKNETMPMVVEFFPVTEVVLPVFVVERINQANEEAHGSSNYVL